jgi:hypothetical protein
MATVPLIILGVVFSVVAVSLLRSSFFLALVNYKHIAPLVLGTVALRKFAPRS